MGSSRQEYWGGLPLSSPGDLPNPEIKLGSLQKQADSSPSEPPGNMLKTAIKKNNDNSLEFQWHNVAAKASVTSFGVTIKINTR